MPRPASPRSALITGASSGIGTAFARLLAADGVQLALVARREDRLQALAESLRTAHGIRVEVVPLDLSVAGAADRLLAELSARDFVVDTLINNAGFGLHGPFAETDPGRQQEMIQLNILALTALCRVFLPPMLERGDGRILNVASTAAFQSLPYMAVYAATKAYVLSFSEALAEEVARRGVTVTCLCPGPTESEFTATAEFKTPMVDKAPFMTAEAVAGQGLAALRAGTPVEVTGVINRLGTVLPRFMPRRLQTRVAGAIFKPQR